MAVSLTAQTLVVGALIAIPLIYGDRLPDFRQYIPLSLPTPPPPAAPPQQAVARSTSPHPTYARARIVAPMHILPLSEIPEVSASEAPPTLSGSSFEGVPGGTGSGPFLQNLFREPVAPPKPRPADPPAAPAAPLRVVSDVQAAKLIKKVIPVYPALARQARVSGTVQLLGIIAKDGTIQQLQVVSGHPLLVKAALDAVRQWIYRPTLLNGQAVEVIAPIDVIFTLGQ